MSVEKTVHKKILISTFIFMFLDWHKDSEYHNSQREWIEYSQN